MGMRNCHTFRARFFEDGKYRSTGLNKAVALIGLFSEGVRE
ncbi:MAG: hypothetical protein NTZ52_02085 [Chlamydiae bacterium]|nr:hypothetical protein [Chlamydiota bacterium]